MRKNSFIQSIVLFSTLSIGLFLFTEKTYAATLNTVSDTISTSRPSASAPISGNVTSSTVQFNVADVYTTSSSIWLASDSATFRPDTGETIRSVTIASASAASGGVRTIYLVSAPASGFHQGDDFTVPIPAVHTFQFANVNTIPSSGKIVISFPALTTGDANVPASPSASTFQFNGIAQASFKVYDVTASSDITANFTANSGSIAMTNPTNGTSPIITLTQGTTTTIAANHTIRIFAGCTALTGSGSAVACSTAVPTILNPTKSSTTGGSADTWAVTITTQDASSNPLDSAKIRIATVEAVQVQATVDPTLTVTIAGLANNSNFQSSSGSCPSETSNAGIDATATFVNLGVLGSGVINKAGQTITVSTNAANGYTITATSSGRFINPATGAWIFGANSDTALTANDTPIPNTIAAGTPGFGIFPCGSRVTTSSPNWVGGSAIGSGAKGSNPWNNNANNFYATIASYTGGAVSADVTVIRYAATISGTTPAGNYSNYFTYVVAPSF